MVIFMLAMVIKIVMTIASTKKGCFWVVRKRPFSVPLSPR